MGAEKAGIQKLKILHFRSRKIKETGVYGTKEKSPKMKLPQNEGKT